MKKISVVLAALFMSYTSFSQIDVFSIVGKKGDDFSNKIGFGGFLKVSYPVNNDADEITAEVGLLGLDGYDLAFVPMKAAYGFTFNREGYGFYVEPQAGYAIGDDFGEKASGFAGNANIGYLFRPAGGVSFDLAIRNENIFSSLGNYHFVGLRIAHNFSLRRREN